MEDNMAEACYLGIGDVFYIIQYLAQLQDPTFMPEQWMTDAIMTTMDINGDCEIGVQDAVHLSRTLLRLLI